MENDNIYDKLKRVGNVRKDDRQHKQEVLAEQSKTQLIKVLQKKFQTTFIGALSAFEKEFGSLWGFGSNKPLTEKQKSAADVWERVRIAILNNGNNQLRAVLNELQQYTTTFNGYKLTFTREDDSNGNE